MKKNHLIAAALSIVAIACVALIAVKFTADKPAQQPQSSASATAAIVDGTHYRTLSSPLATDSSGVSVMEFFWYGCPHCQAFEPGVKEWLKTAPSDVVFSLKPVGWNDATRLHAAMYFVGLKSNNPAQLHDELFELVIGMRQERSLDKQIDNATELFAKYGIEAASLKESLQAADVTAAVTLAEQQMRAAEVASTPSVLVGGRYMVLNNEAVAEAGVFNVVDALIEKARQ